MPANTEFQDFLNTKIRTWRGMDQSLNGEAISRFQILNVSGLDYKGQVSSGYGEKGLSLSADISIDLLDFFAPGIPGLSAKAGVKASGQVTKETLVVLQRFPGKVFLGRTSMLPVPQPEDPKKPNPAPVGPVTLWSTEKPITLLTLDGRNAQFQLTLSIGLDANPLPASIDEMGAELTASAKANATIKGKVIRLRDKFPSCYPSASDENLSKAEALALAVDNLLGNPTKADVKQEVDAWIEGMVTDWLNNLSKVPQTTPLTKQGRLDKIKGLLKDKIYVPAKQAANNKIAQLKEDLRLGVVDEMAEKIEDTLNKYIFSKIDIKFEAPVIAQLLGEWTNPALKTNDLLNRLTDPTTGLRVNISNSNADAATKKAALDQLDIYVNLLQQFTVQQLPASAVIPQTIPPVLQPTFRNYLSYFQLFSFAGGIGASAGASGGIKTDPTSGGGTGANKEDSSEDSILPAPEEISLFLKAGAGVSINGEAQVMSYRFQSFCYDGGAPMVQTQDTWVTYRRLDAEANVFITAGFPQDDLDKQKQTEESNKQQTGGAKSLNAMTYQSVVRYWLHPAVGTESTTTIKPGNGSGVCFGMSVSSSRLLRYVNMVGGWNTARGMAFIKSIARQLRVPETKVMLFINKSNLKGLDTLSAGFPATVFFESSFAFPDDVQMTLNKKSAKPTKSQIIDYYDPADGFSDPAIKNFLKTLDPPPTTTPSPTDSYLEAIRLRFRLADFDSSSETLFKLGIPIFKSSLNIDLSRIRGAGQEALFDYHVEWYNNKDYNPDPKDPKKPDYSILAMERSVPPVVLLHL